MEFKLSATHVVPFTKAFCRGGLHRASIPRTFVRRLDLRTSTARRRLPARALLDEVETTQPSSPDSSLINDDFQPTTLAQRTFSVLDIAALWIGLVVCIPTYTLAASLIDMGMSWSQGMLTIGLANFIVLVPMILNGHPGTKYGVPFPVLARAAFGIHGSNIPSMMRALVACGWFGIQTWIGGEAIFTLLNAAAGGSLSTVPWGWLGISGSQLACFMLFWACQVAIIVRGIESIRVVEKYAAPVLIGLSLMLLGWAYCAAGGFGTMLSTPSMFGPGMPKHGQFWGTFFPALTANVGFWATLALNIPDFTRYAKTQKDQFLGQAIGLPFFMVAFSFLGLAVTSSTTIIFGYTIADPLQVLSRVGGVVPTFLAITGLVTATLSTNIAANVVAPANALVNLSPGRFTFTLGGVATAIVGALIMPWKLMSSTSGYIFTWLIGYSALLGPVTGILLADYYIIRRRQLDVDALFSKERTDKYWYQGGYNPVALACFAGGVLPNIPGFLQAAGMVSTVPAIFTQIYVYAWFVGFTLSAVSYVISMRMSGNCLPSQPSTVL
ncbi:hypothetical protein CYMTET_4008 [Cymbomonas tetramitiformis]|uniref:Uncharacterized protein n=1 Tax=Cymbomonas tetramitiformis TaxID=36881 RepID=A0AAE0H282_9CHLO|nr:hypothetical protein CYMTET_4008 [Cymbomonas tetramitiformis]